MLRMPGRSEFRSRAAESHVPRGAEVDGGHCEVDGGRGSERAGGGDQTDRERQGCGWP